MLLGNACSRGDANAALWQGTIDTLPSGTIHVTNPDAGIWDSASAWRMVEAVRIGTDEAEGPASFADVRAIEVDDAGRIYVLEAEAQEIRVFDSSGTYVRTIGRKGSGPGELKDAIGLAWDPAGRLWAVDQANARFTAFDTAGNYLTDKRRLFATHFTWIWTGRFLHDGRIIEWVPGEEMDKPARLIRLDSITFAARDTFQLPAFEGNFFEKRDKNGWIRASVPFSPGITWVVDRQGNLWFGTQDQYRIYQRRLEGDTLRIVEKAFTPIPVTSAEKDSALGRFEWFTQQGGTIDPSRVPARKPAFSSFFPDDRGNLWVAATSTEARWRKFDIFDTEGRYLGRIDSPVVIEQTPLFRGDVFYVISRDSMDVPFVVRGRVIR
jgi:hypothetical protein